MKIELHLLQNFAPSNLNRDDTGAPKDCELGGHRRARISSQCQKRAVREAFRIDGLVAEDQLGARTKRLVNRVADVLVETHGHEREAALDLAMGAIEGVGLGRTKKGEGEDAWKTEYLIFVPRRTVTELASLLHGHRTELDGLVAAPATEPDVSAPTAKKKEPNKKKAKSDAKAAYPKEIQKKVEGLLEGARNTADLALFGRMIADKPDWNVEASCQVAHAISTNRVQMDFDFFTAVDDFKPGDTAGSDMMGTIQFNSSCFYRYAVLDVAALSKNLEGGDGATALIETTTKAFLRAFVSAIPTGKQNGMAAHNFPSYALAVVRESGPSVSLTNAFLKPARPSGQGEGEKDLVDASIAKLEEYLVPMRQAMGASGKNALVLSWADRKVTPAGVTRSDDLDGFFDQVAKRALGATA